MEERFACALCGADFRQSLHVAAPLGQGKRVCVSCVSILEERYKKLLEGLVPPGYDDRYRWRATLDSGVVVNQYGPDGTRHSVGVLDFENVKRIYFETPFAQYPTIDLRVRLDQGERAIAFRQQTVAGDGLVDSRQVVGLKRTIGKHSEKFFVLCCVDRRIIVSSTDDID